MLRRNCFVVLITFLVNNSGIWQTHRHPHTQTFAYIHTHNHTHTATGIRICLVHIPFPGWLADGSSSLLFIIVRYSLCLWWISCRGMSCQSTPYHTHIPCRIVTVVFYYSFVILLFDFSVPVPGLLQSFIAINCCDTIFLPTKCCLLICKIRKGIRMSLSDNGNAPTNSDKSYSESTVWRMTFYRKLSTNLNSDN